MAENKKGFVLYADQRTIIDMLPNEKAGELFKHIFAYVNDENPISEDALINLAFEPIKLQLKRDLKKWESIRVSRSEAGKKSAEIRKQQKEQVLTSVDFVQQDSTNSTVIVKVKDKVINNNNIVESIDFDVLLHSINKTFGRKFKLISDKVKKSFNARLKEGYGKDDIKHCILNLKNDSFHKENGYKYCTPEFISRSLTLDKYSDVPKINSDNVYVPQQDLN